MPIEGTRGPGLTADQLPEISHVSTPDRLSTPFGEFEFFDGVKKPDSVQAIFDGLDLVRGITAFLDTIPGAALVAMHSASGECCGEVGVEVPSIPLIADDMAV